jgi:polyisoprenoid-binding protein YceI
MKSKINSILTAAIIGILSMSFVYPVATTSIDATQSTIKWTGYHLAKSYEHHGHVQIKSGSVEHDNGTLTGGTILLDMTALTNDDLTKAKDNAKLVKDLKSERFFNVADFPTASLTITKATKTSGGAYDIMADVTIRGITNPVEFQLTQTSSNDAVVFDGKLAIDRTKFDVMYGWSIENAMLSNTIDLEVHIVAGLK